MTRYSEYDRAFNQADAAVFQTVPPGIYQAYVERAIFAEPDYSEYPRLRLTLKIVHGPYRGAALFAQGDCHPDYIKYLKGMLIKMGFDPPPPPSEIEDRCRDMLDRILEVKVSENRTRPEYPKVYINRFVRMVGEEPPALDEEPPPHTDEDIPF